MSLYFVYSERFKSHLTGNSHPEQPSRVQVIFEALSKAHLLKEENTICPRIASIQELLLVHTQSYIEKVIKETQILDNESLIELSTGDTMISSHSFEIASLAVGGVLQGIDEVMSNHCKSVFCIVRPPGHHAFADHGEGFCIFNNVAIGARYAQKKWDIERILIVDWDLHHGNGTQDIFYEDPTVFYFSTHQSPLYPRTGKKNEVGKGKGKGYTMNFSISFDAHPRLQILEALKILALKMEDFKPQLVMISAGFDAHKEDFLGRFDLTDEDFATMTYMVKEIAKRHAHGRIVSVLEGGYHLDALARSSLVHAKALN